jgi:hypothetical protein
MARERIWRTTIDGAIGVTDHTVSLYSGPGTVQRIVGSLAGGSTSNPAAAMLVYCWTINVGAAAADPLVRGQDAESMLIRGAGIVPNRNVATLYSDPGPYAVHSDGQRIIGAGEQVWLRFRALSGGVSWQWFYELRVLVLLPEA